MVPGGTLTDLTIALENRPGALAEMGEALGRAGVSIEGGGAFVTGGQGVAHFLFADGAAARAALETAGIQVLKARPVLVQRLNQSEPGQLGKISRRMADAGVNIEVLYSDHEHQLILAADDMAKGQAVSEAWAREREREEKRPKHHRYDTHVQWTGNDGNGTKTYRSYRRDYSITSREKRPIDGSSDPAFRGDPGRYNPEELLVASLASCHMLWYLHLCAVSQVNVLSYEDTASGIMREEENGSGAFVGVRLSPSVTISAGSDRAMATALHAEAHRLCFIANSVNFPVEIAPQVQEAVVAS